MRLILGLTILGVVLVTLGLLGLYVDVTRRLHHIEDQLKKHNAEISDHKRDIRVIKERAAQESDKVVVVHEWKADNAPEIGGF